MCGVDEIGIEIGQLALIGKLGWLCYVMYNVYGDFRHNIIYVLYRSAANFLRHSCKYLKRFANVNFTMKSTFIVSKPSQYVRFISIAEISLSLVTIQPTIDTLIESSLLLSWSVWFRLKLELS